MAEAGILGALDRVTSELALPLIAVLLALFAARLLGTLAHARELGWPARRLAALRVPLEHAAFTCVHAARSSFSLVAGFSVFGDSTSTHPALGWGVPAPVLAIAAPGHLQG